MTSDGTTTFDGTMTFYGTTKFDMSFVTIDFMFIYSYGLTCVHVTLKLLGIYVNNILSCLISVYMFQVVSIIHADILPCRI